MASSVFSRPQTNVVQEARSYCDERPAQDLGFLASTTSGVPFFLANSDPDRSSFMQQNGGGIDAFAELLLEIGGVFGLSRNTLHVFHDGRGNSMAFNSNGSLFFNYRYFAQLHLAGMRGDPLLRAQAMVFWWVVACHELAHNLVADHSSDHSYWLEAFVTQYFPAVAGRMVQLASAPAAPAGVSQTGAPAQIERSFM